MVSSSAAGRSLDCSRQRLPPSCQLLVDLHGERMRFGWAPDEPTAGLTRWLYGNYIRKTRVTGSECVSIDIDDLKIVFLSIFTPCLEPRLAMVQLC